MFLNIDLDVERPIIIDGILTDYTVTTDGDVYSYKGYKTDKPRKLVPVKGHAGYMKVNLNIGKKEKMYSVHRLVANAFIPNLSNKSEVNHKSGNKKDNRVHNLEWCTSKENIQHAIRTGLKTFKKCQEHPMSTISNKTAIKICELLQSGEYNYKEISKITNSSYSIVKKIKNRYRWKEISKNYDFTNYNKFRKE